MNQIRRLLELEYYWGEYLADRIIGDSEPGGFWRFFFRAPIYLYAWGLHGLCSRNVLLITTQGRKTGKPRTTPVGYLFDAASGTYYWWPVGRGRPIGIGTRWHSPRFESRWAVRRSMPSPRELMIKRWPSTLPLMRSAIHSLSVCI